MAGGQTKFDQYESAILLDSYLAMKNGEFSREEAVAQVSRDLRMMAVNRGIEIDSAYRSVKGIPGRFYSMDAAFTGKTSDASASKVFVDVVNLFRSDPKAYAELLSEARRMVSGTTFVQEDFTKYLEEKAPGEKPEVLLACLEEIEAHCRDKAILKGPLFQETDPAVLGDLRKIVEKDLARWPRRKKKQKRMMAAIGHYCNYVRQNQVSMMPGENTDHDSSGITSKKKAVKEVSGQTAIGDTPETIHPDYADVLRKSFPGGFRLDSDLETGRFRQEYESLHGTSLPAEDENVISIIQSLCIESGGRGYLPDQMVPEALREILFRRIDEHFAAGATAIYYQALYDELLEEFLDSKIYNASMLHAYLASQGGGRFICFQDYIAREEGATPDLTEEVRRVLSQAGRPMTTGEICRALPYLPQDSIKGVLRDKEFIKNGQDSYLHESVLALSDEDLEKIAGLIGGAIEDRGFISSPELYDAVGVKYPDIRDNNPDLTATGLRDFLAERLGNRFCFRGNLISRAGVDLSRADVFSDYARKHSTFTLAELQYLSDALGSSSINFEAVYKHSLRISQNRFVSNSQAQFPVAETDAAIDLFCHGDFISLQDIRDFTLFPYAGFPWNRYLLEQYAARFSEKYTLLHRDYAATDCVGAVVKKDADLGSYDDVLAVALAESDTTLEASAALRYLRDRGFLVRSKYSGIESVLLKSRALRNEKEDP